MNALGSVLAAGSRLIGNDPNQYCDTFNVTYQHRVDDPGAPSLKRTEAPHPTSTVWKTLKPSWNHNLFHAPLTPSIYSAVHPLIVCFL